MRASGAAATCVPVRVDAGDWEAAIFFRVAGAECKADRRALRTARAALPIILETDLIPHANAAVAVLRIEVYTRPDDPLIGEILITPGAEPEQHRTLKLLTAQARLPFWFADADCRILYAPQIPFDADTRREFQTLLDDATQHDALTRVTGRYDAGIALAEVAGRYELRRPGQDATATSQ